MNPTTVKDGLCILNMTYRRNTWEGLKRNVINTHDSTPVRHGEIRSFVRLAPTY